MFEKILSFFGIAYDISENTRKTHTDVKDNTSSLKRYEVDASKFPDVLDDEDIPTSRSEYKARKKVDSDKENIR